MSEFVNLDSVFELGPEELKKECNLDDLDFETTDDLESLNDIIGQEKAIKALKIGTEINAPGYNIFVSGLSGTGRLSTVKKILKSLELKKKTYLKDMAYVYNFKKPDSPRLIILPKGMGKEFEKDMLYLVEYAIENLSVIFEDEEYLMRKNIIQDKYLNINEKNFHKFSLKLHSENFKLIESKSNGVVIPEICVIINNNAISMQALKNKIANDEIKVENIEEIESKFTQMRKELDALIRKNNKLEKGLREELELLKRKTALDILRSLIDKYIEKYWNPQITNYLLEVQESIVSNLILFRVEEGATKKTVGELVLKSKTRNQYNKYKINLVLDNSENTSFPIIIETDPSYTKLFGTVEKIMEKGVVKSDFTKIKSGSLLQANGGFLIINATELLDNEKVWKNLKRVLKYKKLEIKPPEGILESASTIEPEPINIDLKVIIIGDDHLYNYLYNYDIDFEKIFKINPEFDYKTKLTQNTILDYARFIKKTCDEENLLAFDKNAVKIVIEHCLREVENKKYISTRFGKITDLLREANYWCLEEGEKKAVSQEHIKKAITEMKIRNNLIEEKISSYIKENIYLINTSSNKVGQVNGLTVFDIGKYVFGKPIKITASTSKGDEGFINIERESKLSGNIYDKGILILSGYIKENYFKNMNINLNVSICFEQSYGHIDGDSASLAEICAILSSLSDIPIKQYIAITGSMNQKGDVQAVGGINYKIEGFFNVCKIKTLNEKQGVIIPYYNMDDLILNDEVIKAVKENKFHIYPVKRVEEAIEILTGYKIGTKDNNGDYPKNTINQCIFEYINSDKNEDENEIENENEVEE